MKYYDIKRMTGTLLSISLAAAVAAASSGCAGRSGAASAPADPNTSSTVSAAAAEPDSAAAASGTAAPAPSATGKNPVSDFLSGSSAGSGSGNTGAAGADTSTGKANSSSAHAGSSGISAGISGSSAGTGSPDHSAAGEAGTGDTQLPPGTAGNGTGDDNAEETVTDLKEEELDAALAACTGWGQSAGSSLHAASAATQLLCWANAASAGNADPQALEDAVRDEISKLSDQDLDNLKENWSSVSFNVSMILDDFDEVSGLLEDAGCKETAKDAAKDQQAAVNWAAAEAALGAVLD